MASIYKLIDPTTKRVVYIGLTTSSLELRLKNHLQSKKKTPVNLWIMGLKTAPVIKLIENVNSDTALERERYWILRYNKNSSLLNVRHLRSVK